MCNIINVWKWNNIINNNDKMIMINNDNNVCVY